MTLRILFKYNFHSGSNKVFVANVSKITTFNNAGNAGLICTKLRSRLDDATVDTLCFLRSHYRDNN